MTENVKYNNDKLGVWVKVKAFPGSKSEKIIREDENSFKMYIREPAERGLANERVLQILKDIYKTNNIRFLKGARSQNKIFEIKM